MEFYNNFKHINCVSRPMLDNKVTRLNCKWYRTE